MARRIPATDETRVRFPASAFFTEKEEIGGNKRKEKETLKE